MEKSIRETIRANLKRKMLAAGGSSRFIVTDFAEMMWLSNPANMTSLVNEVDAELHGKKEEGLMAMAGNMAAEPSFKDVVAPVVEYLRENHCPHVKVLIDSSGAELLGGLEGISFEAEPEFDEEVTPENIKVGDMLTVKEWISDRDNSYKGDLLEVKKIALPHVFVERSCKYGSRPDRLQFDLNKVIFQRVTQDFIDGHNWLRNKNEKAA